MHERGFFNSVGTAGGWEVRQMGGKVILQIGSVWFQTGDIGLGSNPDEDRRLFRAFGLALVQACNEAEKELGHGKA